MTEQRDESDGRAPKYARMERLGVGIYDDGHGSIHVDAQEICDHFGVENSDSNFKTLLRAIFDASDEFEIPSVQVTR